MSLGASLLCLLFLLLSVEGAPLNEYDAKSPIKARRTERYGSPISSLVDLGYAKYQGVSLEAGVNQYLGMRFAAPPVGDLRWRAPQDPETYDEVQDALQFGATCIGVGQSVGGVTAEDCLFMDIFTPSNATTESKLPVWFFIQGGGYAVDSDQNFNGTEVVMQSNYSMMFVQINYRVGAFGFLASEKIRANGDLNVGLLDQRKALHWVQKYIHLFGGDPEHVVIHGDSAGAGSIAFQLAAYGGRDDKLFVGAMAESPFWPTHRTVEDSEFQFDRFVANVSCSEAEDVMACLRSKDIATLQGSDVDTAYPEASAKGDWYFLPVVDGDFSQDLLYNQFEQGKFVRVPSLVGDDNDEGTGFSPNATSETEFLQFIKDNYPKLTDDDLQSISKTYPLGDVFPKHAAYFTPAEEAYGESTFTCPGIEMSSKVAAFVSESKSWNYRYNVYDNDTASQGLGVPHVSEKPAIWGPGNSGVGSCKSCSYLTYNAPIVPIVMNYWISFIVSLNPNTYKHPTAPEWESWGTQSGQRLKIELDATEMELVPSDQLQRCEFWKSLAGTMEQ